MSKNNKNDFIEEKQQNKGGLISEPHLMKEKIHYLCFDEDEIWSPCRKGDIFTLNIKKVSCVICRRKLKC